MCPAGGSSLEWEAPRGALQQGQFGKNEKKPAKTHAATAHPQMRKKTKDSLRAMEESGGRGSGTQPNV